MRTEGSRTAAEIKASQARHDEQENPNPIKQFLDGIVAIGNAIVADLSGVWQAFQLTGQGESATVEQAGASSPETPYATDEQPKTKAPEEVESRPTATTTPSKPSRPKRSTLPQDPDLRGMAQ